MEDSQAIRIQDYKPCQVFEENGQAGRKAWFTGKLSKEKTPLHY